MQIYIPKVISTINNTTLSSKNIFRKKKNYYYI